MSGFLKVIDSEEKTIESGRKNELLAALILNTCPEPVSLTYIKLNGLDKNVNSNFGLNPDMFSELTFDNANKIILDDLTDTAKNALSRNNSTGIPIANLVKSILNKKVLEMNKSEEIIEETPTVMSIEDLKAKLFNNIEEKGRTK